MVKDKVRRPQVECASSSTLVVGQQGGHPACKTAGCWFAGGEHLTGALHVESQPGLLRTKVYSAFHPSGVGK